MSLIREIPFEELNSVYEVMAELRPHITVDQFKEIYKKAHTNDQYTLYGYFENEKCYALMGVRYLYDYVHLFHLYIDDLIVSSKQRSNGVGAKLLKFAEKLANDNKCTGLRLCTGVDNKDGIRFYEREKWLMRAVVFKKKQNI